MAELDSDRQRLLLRLGLVKSESQQEAENRDAVKRAKKAGKRISSNNTTPEFLEKQKLRTLYKLTDRQLSRYVTIALAKHEPTGDALMTLLEMRLDNVAFRIGMASTIEAARELIRHDYILVDGKRVRYPGRLLRPGETVSVASNEAARYSVKESFGKDDSKVPEHLQVDPENWSGKVLAYAPRSSVPQPVNEDLVIKFYTKDVL
jgi:small subunit ribosomal protein S4